MRRSNLAALVMCSLAALGAFAVEEPVTVTTFQLKDGGKIEALRYSVLTVNNSKGYQIITMEGKKQNLIGNDVISREEESVPFEKLPEKTQKEVLSMRAAASAARNEAAADKKGQQDAAAARRRARDAHNTLKTDEEALALAKMVLANAEKIVKDIPVEIARYDAEYDAAKAELSESYSTHIIGAYGVLDHQRADYLRNVMVRAAENKVRAEQSRKDTQDLITRRTETIKQLEASIDTAKKDFEAAEADAKAIAQIAKEDALEREKKAAETRVEPPPQDTLTVLTLKDGTALKAVTILEDPDGRLAVKDEQGKVHYLSAKDIVKREQMK